MERDVHCLFGLAVDNCSLTSTKDLLRQRIRQGQKTVLSTININWIAQTLRNEEFRDIVNGSDLVVIDGKPLLWLAQLLGCPMRETVPGSTLIQELLEEQVDQPLTIFLLGGEGDTAKLAMQNINRHHNGGLRAVGALNPGHGTVEELSTAEILNAVNSTQPDILLVALGAKKGTLWIERNRCQLNAKVISHLGATINFLAGTVHRAPRFVQSSGLEWAWRIIQEPKLFSRYALDALTLMKFLFPRIPVWLQYRVQARRIPPDAPLHSIELHSDDPNTIILHPPARLQARHAKELRHIIAHHSATNRHITIDFRKTVYADGAFWGTLVLLQRCYSGPPCKIAITNFTQAMRGWARLFQLPLNQECSAKNQ
nr:WecB/TagA/CpsF family glycosyltransferase [uncultured Desulfobulbus sp.]